MLERRRKRQSLRLHMEAETYYEELDGSKRRTVTKSLNISRSGIAIIAKKKISKGMNMNIHVFIPNEETSEFGSAVTVWSEKLHGDRYITGLRFTEFNFQARENLIKHAYDSLQGHK